jgi:hypothetical protein
MKTSGTHLDATVRIPVLEPLRGINDSLLDLLRGFTAENWRRPTVHPDRNVKDLTAHLLQTTLNRVSIDRDGYRLLSGSIASIEDLIALIQRENREFMTAMRWVSPQILIDLLAIYDREMVAGFERLDLDGAGIGVAWAGEAVSRNWFDIARMYTEKWHHQQQLRDSTGRLPLYQTVSTPGRCNGRRARRFRAERSEHLNLRRSTCNRTIRPRVSRMRGSGPDAS